MKPQTGYVPHKQLYGVGRASSVTEKETKELTDKYHANQRKCPGCLMSNNEQVAQSLLPLCQTQPCIKGSKYVYVQ